MLNPSHELEVIYHDGPCWIVSKPAGVATQAPAEFDSMEARIRTHWRKLENKEGKIYVGVPHRLDRPVSGALIFARHVRAARRICEQFQHRTVKKSYVAVVDGLVQEAEGQWTDWIVKIEGEARVRIAEPAEAGAVEAKTLFRVLSQHEAKTVLEITPETGRMHQIRIQASSRGFPVLGDHQYGSQSHFGPQNVEPRQMAIALHARSLQFRHPMRDEEVQVEAPFPEGWP